MPGSIRTGTAPALKSAKVRAKNSRLGVHHQHGPHAAADADGVEPGGDAVALLVELAEGEVRVADAPARSRPAGKTTAGR